MPKEGLPAQVAPICSTKIAANLTLEVLVELDFTTLKVGTGQIYKTQILKIEEKI